MRTRNRSLAIGCFLLLVGLSGCQPQYLPLKAYLHWVNDSENKLSVEKHINGLAIKVKYVSPEYLVYMEESREKAPYTKPKHDSLLLAYRNSKTFLMNIAPDAQNHTDADIITKGISDYGQFKDRVSAMNFHMDAYVTLKTDQGEFKPVLTTMENTYGLTGYRNIYFVFAPNGQAPSGLRESKVLDFVYRDEIFDMGTSHFVFEEAVISKAPVLRL